MPYFSPEEAPKPAAIAWNETFRQVSRVLPLFPDGISVNKDTWATRVSLQRAVTAKRLAAEGRMSPAIAKMIFEMTKNVLKLTASPLPEDIRNSQRDQVMNLQEAIIDNQKYA